MSEENFLIRRALRTIDIESRAIEQLRTRIDEAFVVACNLMLKCKGRVVVIGMGKSGLIGRKIAATLSSTGTPAMFVHPGEASHGDLGMITDQDVVIAISYSGTASEIITLLPILKRKAIPLISITGDPESILATTAQAHLNGQVAEEACPLGLAPTTSTTVTLVLGDALATALLEARGFTPEEFAFSHPGGKLGRRLLLKVKDIMHGGNAIPKVSPDTLLRDALLEVSTKGLGMTTVIDQAGHLCGVFTDGDLRRTLDSGKDIHKTTIREVMSVHCKKIQESALATEAVLMMQENSVYTLIVTNAAGELEGVIRMHDLLQANVV